MLSVGFTCPLATSLATVLPIDHATTVLAASLPCIRTRTLANITARSYVARLLKLSVRTAAMSLREGGHLYTGF